MSGPSEDADAASTLYLGSEDYVVRLDDCLLVVYRCARALSPHPPPCPGHSFPDCLLILCRCTPTRPTC